MLYYRGKGLKKMFSWLYALISTTLVSLISLVGILSLSLKKQCWKKISPFFVSLAVGTFFGDSLIHLIPESFEKLGINLQVSFLIISGILIFFILEKFLHWRHCHTPTTAKHQHPLATMNLVGDGLHNLLDGMIIGVSYLISIRIGLATTIAVIFHEIPQEISDFGVLVYAGFSTKKALFFNFLSGITAIIGTLLALLISSLMQNLVFYLLPITAGGFLYIAGSDLIPEIKEECKPSSSFIQFFLIVLGILIMGLLTILE